MKKIQIYDTTLRDGAQTEDISFSLEDKLRIVEQLDTLGVHYIEGGWPGANPKDVAFFKQAQKLRLSNATITAFGSTHKADVKVQEDPGFKKLLDAGTSVITIFGKTWDFHAKTALGISLERNLELIHDSVRYLDERVDTVFFDAEHFFDGYRANPDYAMKCLEAARDGGAAMLVLCDTNGGTLTGRVAKAVREVRRLKTLIGIHAHNDSELAVANSLTAIENGAVQVQGTINGLGERCGNANLCSVMANLSLKMDKETITKDQLRRLRETSRFVNEIANIRHAKQQPFVGDSAFAHKGGIHVSAIQKHPQTYEHIDPELVGNSQRVLVSDMAGQSNVLRKASDFGLVVSKGSPALEAIVTRLKDLEHQGFQFEGAEGSFELLMKKVLGTHQRFFDLIGFRVIVEKRKEGEDPLSEATIMVRVGGHVEHTAATGDGPVNALDNALRKALERFYPSLKAVTLLDYKVRVLAAGRGTGAKVRVLVESGDGETRWGTVGVSENIIEASWQALVDSIEFKLLRDGT